MTVFAIVSCLSTALSYYYRNYLINLVSNDLKQISINKLYRLEEKTAKEQEKRILGIVYQQSGELSSYFVLLPDNLYIFFLITVLLFFELKAASSSSVWAGLLYFF
jgi:hypothetical protein